MLTRGGLTAESGTAYDTPASLAVLMILLHTLTMIRSRNVLKADCVGIPRGSKHFVPQFGVPSWLMAS